LNKGRRRTAGRLISLGQSNRPPGAVWSTAPRFSNWSTSFLACANHREI
jgi:hypothetical protein